MTLAPAPDFYYLVAGFLAIFVGALAMTYIGRMQKAYEPRFATKTMLANLWGVPITVSLYYVLVFFDLALLGGLGSIGSLSGGDVVGKSFLCVGLSSFMLNWQPSQLSITLPEPNYRRFHFRRRRYFASQARLVQ